ncbi:hypothetical protein [Argonema galeatum]|uniref:hypothetical protein n=1 Tax=Argonema galeatum TaxID=2942762 RepID=UPI002010C749|nr:hypothetical protein [Argonema galeatum]MCL1463253.1 hypothetical protein [Argonema galeatum A003/A1]
MAASIEIRELKINLRSYSPSIYVFFSVTVYTSAKRMFDPPQGQKQLDGGEKEDSSSQPTTFDRTHAMNHKRKM